MTKDSPLLCPLETCGFEGDIAELTTHLRGTNPDALVAVIVRLVKEKQKAIPIEKIDAFLKQYQNEYDGHFIIDKLREILEGLKE